MAATTDRPNIVFILCDNVGWGDFSCYGSPNPSPRIDKLASEGIRFTNYCVEAQCTPSRSALMTGRYSVRSGNYKLPWPGQGAYGLVPWEYTIASLLSDAGYATALHGKWHVGEAKGRTPIDHGFDEFWGYLNTADECGYTAYAMYRELAKEKGIETPKVWEGTKGGELKAVAEMDMKIRPYLDEKIVEKATDFIKRKAKGGEPFFAYVSLSHLHPPEQPHPDFDQTSPTRLGTYADLLAEIDYRVGQVVDCVEEAGIADNTLVVFSSDNATDATLSAGYGTHGGSNGPWRGEFMTMPWEGSYRTLAMARWPGNVPAGIVSDQMVSIHDWYATFAALAGASDKVPTDRPMDSVDISRFLLGKSETSGRQTLLHFGPDGSVFASKWGNIKAIFRYCAGVDAPILQPQLPLFYDLTSDPREECGLIQAHEGGMGWMFAPVLMTVGEYEKSIAEYPNIPVGADFDGYDKSDAKGKRVLQPASR